MIEGFKVKVGFVELTEHCLARSRYHQRRAEEKEATLPDLKKTLEMVRTSTVPSNYSNMSKGGYNLDPDDPVTQLERDIETHRNKRLVFDFFASHLFNDDYTLEKDDLVKLEILRY